MVRLDLTTIKIKEEMLRFRNNLLVLSYKIHHTTCSPRSLARWLLVLLSKGIGVWPQGRVNGFVCMCVLGRVKLKCLV